MEPFYLGLAHTVRCVCRLLLIGGAVDLEKSDYARVAKIFYSLALKVCTEGSKSLKSKT